MSFYFLVLSFCIFITQLGCQHVDKKYCEDTNWRKEAFLLALQGENRNRISEFQKQCKPFKVEISAQAFNEGFDEGASQFCNSNAGVSYGASGSEYKGTCERHANEIDFLKSYNRGRLSFLKNQLIVKREKLEDSETRLWRKKNEFELESNTNPALAVKAYDELESYQAENERLKVELEGLIKVINSMEIIK